MEIPKEEKINKKFTPEELERIQSLVNSHLNKGWIDQGEADKILAMNSFEDAENYCEQRMSNFSYFGELMYEGIITQEIADQLIKMDPYEAYEKLKKYEEMRLEKNSEKK